MRHGRRSTKLTNGYVKIFVFSIFRRDRDARALKDAGFDVHWNTKKVDATFAESPHDDLVRKFQCSDNGSVG